MVEKEKKSLPTKCSTYLQAAQTPHSAVRQPMHFLHRSVFFGPPLRFMPLERTFLLANPLPTCFFNGDSSPTVSFTFSFNWFLVSSTDEDPKERNTSRNSLLNHG